MVKKNIFLKAAICALLLCGCGAPIETDTNGLQESETLPETESLDRYDLDLAYNAYEKYASTEVQVDGKKIPLELWRSSSNYEVAIIDGQKIPVHHDYTVYFGGNRIEAAANDFNGDGKEEIVLLGSARVEYIQVFGNTNGQWDEIEIPLEIYTCLDPGSVEKQLEELDVKLDTPVKTDGIGISFQGTKILVSYFFYGTTDSGFFDVGKIQKELVYSEEEKKFVLGDTRFLPSDET